ncbi:MAG: alpha-hydroxy acid oxidase [Sporichthyaceae bacterium]
MDTDAWEARARERLSQLAYDYYAGGADDEVTLADNVAAWRRIRLRPRVLRDVSEIDTIATVLGTVLPGPILVAPTAYQRLACDDGERATARGTAAGGSLMVVSTLATVRLEEVAAATPGYPQWMQIYLQRDRAASTALVARAVAAGYRALVLTVDLPVAGNRRRDERNGFTLPPGMTLANLGLEHPQMPGGGSALARHVQQDFTAGMTFADVEWLVAASPLPVLVKGVLRGDDAVACVEAGAAGVIVSNHGGRQLDGAVATADALPEVVAAVGDRAEVYVDGGIRSGTDIVKALALGARAVLVGRPVLWGLAADGAAGVEAVLRELHTELDVAMSLCGAPTIADLTPDLLAR